MKKLTALLIIAALLLTALTLASCGDSSSGDSSAAVKSNPKKDGQIDPFDPAFFGKEGGVVLRLEENSIANYGDPAIEITNMLPESDPASRISYTATIDPEKNQYTVEATLLPAISGGGYFHQDEEEDADLIDPQENAGKEYTLTQSEKTFHMDQYLAHPAKSTDEIKNQKDALEKGIQDAVAKQKEEKEWSGADFSFRNYTYTIDSKGDLYCYSRSYGEEDMKYDVVYITVNVTVTGDYQDRDVTAPDTTESLTTYAALSNVYITTDGKLTYEEAEFSWLYKPEEAEKEHFTRVADLEDCDIIKMSW